MTPLRWFEGLGNGLLISVGMVLIWRAFPRRREIGDGAIRHGDLCALRLPAAAIGGLAHDAGNRGAGFFLSTCRWGPRRLLADGRAAAREPRPAKQQRVKLDLLGFTLLASSIITLNVMLDMGQYWGWATSPAFRRLASRISGSIWWLCLVGAVGAETAH